MAVHFLLQDQSKEFVDLILNLVLLKIACRLERFRAPSQLFHACFEHWKPRVIQPIIIIQAGRGDTIGDLIEVV